MGLPAIYIWLLDNLASVTQPGTAARTFRYDSLGRLRRATNPESGQVDYVYDSNGNLTTRTDARAAATMTYDELNRVTAKSYTGVTTPAVTLTYDTVGVPYSIGRLTQVAAAGGTVFDYNQYDELGRVKKTTQTTLTAPNPTGTPYATLYEYDRSGALTQETYPSGRVVNYGYDATGRVSSMAGYVTSAAYLPHGAVNALQLANGLWETRTYSPARLQATGVMLGVAQGNGSKWQTTYSYPGTQNNGNVASQQIQTAGLNVTQTYGYDFVNRLVSAEERPTGAPSAGPTKTFGYDARGNRAQTSGSSDPTVPTAVAQFGTNNRITLANVTYDGAGNMTQSAAGTMVYDAENRLTSASGAAYEYDGLGRRVKSGAGGRDDGLGVRRGGAGDRGVRERGDGVVAEAVGDGGRVGVDAGGERLAWGADGVSRLLAVWGGDGDERECAADVLRVGGWDEAEVYGEGAGWGDGAGLFWGAVFLGRAGTVYECRSLRLPVRGCVAHERRRGAKATRRSLRFESSGLEQVHVRPQQSSQVC